MESFTQLINEWEIQLLVLLSFTLQIFLFFTGNVRRYSTNIFLRVTIWLAYLGADFVAVYALGFLSRHAQDAIGGTNLLAFFWAPFLLIHLGGQDTITAFAIEDNNLWLRHLLTLIVQVGLALYVFWKSIGRHNLHLLVPGIFLFLSGIIKYGERTLALMYGSLQTMRESINEAKEEEFRQTNGDDGYSSNVRSALLLAPRIQRLFAGSTLPQMLSSGEKHLRHLPEVSEFQLWPKLLEVELAMMYDDLYTKAIVLRTRSGIILRCISQISAIIALVLFFLVSNKQRCSRADVAITYVLFVGGLFLDFCALFILMKSPWTWAWLKARKCHSLARTSLFLFSSKIGWAESKPLWSNSMGQYCLLRWLEGSDQPTRSCKQRMWVVIGKMMDLVGLKKEKLFWISRLLDIKYTEVDKGMVDSVVQGFFRLAHEFVPLQEIRWPSLGELPKKLREELNSLGFANAIVRLHMFTEVHLRRYPTQMEMGATETVQDVQGTVDVCRKLSNYMMYLLAAHPEMLPVIGRVDAILQSSKRDESDYGLPPCHDTLKEIRDMWILFLAYAAGKSRPEMHAAQLGKGGELITFVWLLMALNGLGDSAFRRNELFMDLSSIREAMESFRRSLIHSF